MTDICLQDQLERMWNDSDELLYRNCGNDTPLHCVLLAGFLRFEFRNIRNYRDCDVTFQGIAKLEPRELLKKFLIEMHGTSLLREKNQRIEVAYWIVDGGSHACIVFENDDDALLPYQASKH